MSVAAVPDLAAILPHLGDALLLDEVTHAGESRLAARLVVRPGTAFSEAAGNLPAWAGPEIMAQAVASLSGLRSLRARGVPAPVGLLLGVRSYQCAAGEFRCGQELLVEVVESSVDEQGWAVFDGTIHSGGELVASGTLTVLQPPDDSFLDAECARND